MRRLLHAIDSAMLGRWSDAKAALQRIGDAEADPVAARLLEFVIQLERSERLRAYHVATLKHEIGNPLAIAQANLEGMIDGVLERSEPRLQGILEALTSAGALLGELTRRPRELEESLPVRVDTFNMCALVAAETAAAHGLAVSKGVKLVYHSCGQHYATCVSYRGDPTRVGQILRNVLINAVRYTPPGGTVDVNCERPDGVLVVSITDTGPGIEVQELPHVFEPGFRGKSGTETAPGSGLGLSVVHHLLEKLGGDARIESREGEGTTFIINLPAAAVSPN